MSILSSPLKGVLQSPLSSPLFSGSMWWLAFDQNASFAYDLVNGRYMRSGGASTQALSLTGVPSGQPVQGVGMTVGAADNPVVVQGLGDEKYSSDNLLVPGGYVNTFTVTETGFDAVFNGSQNRVAFGLFGMVIGGSFRVSFGELASGISAFVREGDDGTGVVIATAYAGSSFLDFVPTTVDMSILFIDDSDDYSITDLSVTRVLPYPGYNTDGTLSEYDLVEGGGFDTQEDVDLWGSTNTDPDELIVSLDTGRMKLVVGAGGITGTPRILVPVRVGKVHVFSLNTDFELAMNSTIAGYEIVDGGSPVQYGMATQDITFLEFWNSSLNSTRYVDNVSLQEVEPGVVIEAVGVWGSVEFNTALTLTDNDDNHIVVRRNASGKIHLRIILGGVSSNYYSTIDWPDDVEGTLRLELTNTDGGCFAAVFLDDVFVIGSDAFDYPQPINQLVLAPVAGVKTITEIYGK